METKPKSGLRISLAVRFCVALLGIGMGVTLLWSEQWNNGAIWMPILLIAVSVLALVLFLRATRAKKKNKNAVDDFEI